MSWLDLLMMLLPLVAMVVCCCSSDTCIIFTDDFSTDRTGTEYTTSAGTWAVGSGVLTCTTASAFIYSNTAVTAGLNGVYVSVKITPATTSDIGRLVIARTDDSNYWFAEVQPGTNHGWLKLYQRSAGTNTLKAASRIDGFQAAEQLTVSLCYASDHVRAYAGTAGVDFAATITIAGTKCGLGTGAGSSSVTFDDFTITKHMVDDATCSVCSTACTAFSDNYATDDLAADYTAVTGAGSVSGGELSSSSATLLIIALAQIGAGRGKVTVKGKSSATSNTVRAVGSYVSGSTYVYAELLFNGASSTFKIFNGTGAQLGITKTITTSLNTYYSLAICWDGEHVFAFLGDGSSNCMAYISAAYTGTGQKGGVGGTRASGTITFDDLTIAGSKVDDDDCPDCGEHLDNDCYCTSCEPDFLGTIDIEITGMADASCGSCEALDGLYTLTRDDASACGGLSNCCSWRYTATSTCGPTITRFSVEIYSTAGPTYNLVCRLDLTNGGFQYSSSWTDTAGSPWDCGAWDGTDVPWSGESTNTFPTYICSGGASTCKITAVSP